MTSLGVNKALTGSADRWIGVARLRVEGGATLSVQRSGASGTAYDNLQGYLVQEGGPERFVSGSTPGGGRWMERRV